MYYLSCTRINFVLILSPITIAHIHRKFFIRGIPNYKILAPPLSERKVSERKVCREGGNGPTVPEICPLSVTPRA